MDIARRAANMDALMDDEVGGTVRDISAGNVHCEKETMQLAVATVEQCDAVMESLQDDEVVLETRGLLDLFVADCEEAVGGESPSRQRMKTV